jgi:RNA polymerase sigma factor for flagellar operon FliA
VPSSTSPTLPLYDELAPIVPRIAGRLKLVCPPSIEVEDLAQAGRTALWAACAAFDPAREATFRVYAKCRIRGAMLDLIREQYSEANREQNAVRLDDVEVVNVEGPDAQVSMRMTISDPFIARAVAGLRPRLALVISSRYAEDLTQQETAERLGVSRARVFQLERDAIKSLRSAIAGRARRAA